MGDRTDTFISAVMRRMKAALKGPAHTRAVVAHGSRDLPRELDRSGAQYLMADELEIPAFLRRGGPARRGGSASTSAGSGVSEAPAPVSLASRKRSGTSSGTRLPKVESSFAQLRVVGVGGVGLAAVDRMIAERLHQIEFIVIDADEQALSQSQAPIRVVIGERAAGAVNPGGEPETGQDAAEESATELGELLAGSDIV